MTNLGWTIDAGVRAGSLPGHQLPARPCARGPAPQSMPVTRTAVFINGPPCVKAVHLHLQHALSPAKTGLPGRPPWPPAAEVESEFGIRSTVLNDFEAVRGV